MIRWLSCKWDMQRSCVLADEKGLGMYETRVIDSYTKSAVIRQNNSSGVVSELCAVD